jgi:3-dehydrosphinganine reductase
MKTSVTNLTAPDQSCAFITGGSSGIGLAVAAALAREGCNLCLFARDPARLAAARQRISAVAPAAKLFIYPVDVGDAAGCAEAVRRAANDAGPPSWAISCAGIVHPLRFLDQPIAAHEEQMRVNYFGSLYFAHAVVPLMIAGGGGRLVFVASAAAICGIYGYTGYGAAKFAVRGLAEALRVELRCAGIGVSLVYAPDTDTPLLAAERVVRSRIMTRIAETGGVWQAEDVASLIIGAAKKCKFAVTAGWRVRLLFMLQGLIAPLFRMYQGWIVGSVAERPRCGS